jgi:hypothetical protein
MLFARAKRPSNLSHTSPCLHNRCNQRQWRELEVVRGLDKSPDLRDVHPSIAPVVPCYTLSAGILCTRFPTTTSMTL